MQSTSRRDLSRDKPGRNIPIPRCIHTGQPKKTMTLIQRCLILSVAWLALIPASAYAGQPKDLSQEEMDTARQMIHQHCTNVAIKQSENPDQPEAAPYQACVKPYLDGIAQMARYVQDPAVSVGVWSDCRRVSDFAQTGNFPGWASCIAQRTQKK